MTGDPQSDEFADELNILAPAVPLIWILAIDGSGVSGRHRINDNEIGLPKQRVPVVNEVERRGGRLLGGPRINHTWADKAHVQPHRGGSRAAVKHECQRPRGGIGVVQGVGRDAHKSLRHMSGEGIVGDLLAAQNDASGGCGVAEVTVNRGDGVVSCHQVISRSWRVSGHGGGFVCRHDLSLGPSVASHPGFGALDATPTPVR